MPTQDEVYQDNNAAKATMDHIYDQSDPRAYFRELEPLNYRIPDQARPAFTRLARALRQTGDEKIRILDLGCSYGVNAALLKYDLSIRDLYEHWGQARLARARPHELVAYDRHYFASLEAVPDIEVYGIDQAVNAVSYAEAVGLIEQGFTENLETQTLSAEMHATLAPVDLLISTGCVGYITETTFEQLMPAVSAGRKPWLANFVLRVFPFDAIAETLAEAGYVTEKLTGRHFSQRRFASTEERTQMCDRLSALGIDPSPENETGELLAELYVSRPAKDAAEMPLEKLLAA